MKAFGPTPSVTKGARDVKRARATPLRLHLGAVHFGPPWPKCWRFTFNSADAIEMERILGLKMLIPIHYEQSVWSHFKEDVASDHRAFATAGLLEKVKWLTRGERD